MNTVPSETNRYSTFPLHAILVIYRIQTPFATDKNWKDVVFHHYFYVSNNPEM